MDKKIHPYKRLAGYFKPHIWIIAVSVVCSIFVNIGKLGRLGAIIPAVNNIITKSAITFAESARVPAFLANIVDAINSMPALRLLYFLMVWVLIIEALHGVFDFFASLFLNMASERLMRDIRSKIYKKFLQLSLDFYSRSSTGKLVSKITYDVIVLKNSVSQGLMDLIKEPLTLIVHLGAVIFCKVFFAIPWRLIVASLVLFLIVIFPVVAIGRKLRKIAKQSLDKMGDINRVLYETISGIRIVKAFSMERYEADRFNKENSSFYKITMKSIKRVLVVRPMTEFVGALSIVILLWLVKDDLIGGDFPFGAFAALIYALLSLMKPIKKLSRVYGIHQQAMAASGRIFELLDTKVSVVEKKGATELPRLADKVTFENVKFNYEDDIVLKSINLEVKKGRIVAIVGPSGTGKTTLVNLIPRFYDITGGKIKIDGKDIREATLNSLWGQIGLVTQDTILFNDTVSANIAYGQPDKVNTKGVAEAAKVANAHDFITKLPKGYDTVIGERGFRLSGGEKQRLAIARAVFKNPPILILDEATSQLDTESERLVQDALDHLMKGRTVFIIAHRLSTIKNADKIIVLNKGVIVEEGRHDDLITKDGLYKRLYDMQFKDIA